MLASRTTHSEAGMARDTTHTTRGRRETAGSGEELGTPTTVDATPRTASSAVAASARPRLRADATAERAEREERRSEPRTTAVVTNPGVSVEIAGHPPAEPPKPAPFVVGNGTRIRTARRLVQ